MYFKDEVAMAGRPALEITQEMIDKAEEMASNGLTMQEIAACLDIGESTLHEKKRNFPEFAAAIKRGKSKGISMMANNLVTLAKSGNAAANIFWLKCQGKWREAKEEMSQQDKKSLVESIIDRL